jgi:hypothetical protein
MYTYSKSPVRVVRFGLNNWQHMIPQEIVPPQPLPPSPVRYCSKPAYNIAKGIRDPSSVGPWTYFAGAVWGYDEFKTGSVGAGSSPGGLT